MNITSNIQLDINFVKNQFPSFKDGNSKDIIFLENAGGSYVPNTVINRLNNFMIQTKVQPYADFESSKIAGEQIDEGIKLFAQMINADFNEIIIADSTTMNMYVLSNALSENIFKNDEIIVTDQDHNANIVFWRKLANKGAIIKEWKVNKETAELEIDDLKNILTSKTKLVAVTHTSNIVGSNNDIKKISEIVHSNGSLIIVDGVSYAPHGFPDVKQLDVDFYSFSTYKTFGPHLGLMYGKYDILKELPNQNHEFVKDELPNITLNPGGPNHEETACLIGVSEYFDNLYDHHFPNSETNRRDKIRIINQLINKHEEKLANIILNFLITKNNVRIIGKTNCSDKNRAPTISFTVNNMSSKEVCNYLVKKNIGIRNGNFYAWRILKALNIDQEDGVVRVSMVHYNTEEDINSLVRILDTIL